MATVGNGTQFAIAKTYGSAINMTAITNAVEAVATLAPAHGVIVGDILEVTSGWEQLNSRIVRAKTVATNDVTFESINTSSTARYPAGGGTGTVRKITLWETLTGAYEATGDGGKQQYADATPLANTGTEVQMPTIRSARSVELMMIDNVSLAWRATVQSAQEAGLAVGLRKTNVLGQPTYMNGFWSIDQNATSEKNAVDKHSVSFTSNAEITRYAA